MTKSSREEKTNVQHKEARRKARQRQKQIRSIIFAMLVVGVLGLAGYFLKEAFFKPAPPPMAGNVIDVEADMAGFDKKEIRDNLIFILPLAGILLVAASRPTLNRLAHWNLHHKEWVRLALGGGVVVMGLLILATV